MAENAVAVVVGETSSHVQNSELGTSSKLNSNESFKHKERLNLCVPVAHSNTITPSHNNGESTSIQLDSADAHASRDDYQRRNRDSCGFSMALETRPTYHVVAPQESSRDVGDERGTAQISILPMTNPGTITSVECGARIPSSSSVQEGASRKTTFMDRSSLSSPEESICPLRNPTSTHGNHSHKAIIPPISHAESCHSYRADRQPFKPCCADDALQASPTKCSNSSTITKRPKVCADIARANIEPANGVELREPPLLSHVASQPRAPLHERRMQTVQERKAPPEWMTAASEYIRHHGAHGAWLSTYLIICGIVHF